MVSFEVLECGQGLAHAPPSWVAKGVSVVETSPSHLTAFPNPNFQRYLRMCSLPNSRSRMSAPGFESKPRRIASAKTAGTSQPQTLADQWSFALRPLTSQRRFWELFGPQTRRCSGENFQFANEKAAAATITRAPDTFSHRRVEVPFRRKNSSAGYPPAKEI